MPIIKMSTFFSRSVVIPRRATIKTGANTLILSTTLSDSTLQTSRLNMDVDTLVLQGANDKVNLIGLNSNFVVLDTSGDVQQPDHSTMNNDYVLWLSPYAGSQAGRTVILKPLTAEYANNLRFTLRNDSGVTFTISKASADYMFGNTTIETNTAVHFSSIAHLGSFGWIACGPPLQNALAGGTGGSGGNTGGDLNNDAGGSAPGGTGGSTGPGDLVPHT